MDLKRTQKGFTTVIAAVIIGLCAVWSALGGCDILQTNTGPVIELSEVPEFSGEAYVEINGGVPEFDEEDMTERSFERYSRLDALGRCGTAYANLCVDTMPTEERGNIGMVKPTGWQTSKYDFVDGKYLYNRCHLIGYQLSGENANERNLITGTRYMNTEGMLPFENEVAEYIDETGNHVLYRVTPVFEGDEMLARGVVMEAMSVEDNGSGVCFNVYCYNVQPGVTIDYATGENELSDSLTEPNGGESRLYILNTGSKKYHLPSCEGAQNMNEDNRSEFTGTSGQLEMMGYSPCGSCNP